MHKALLLLKKIPRGKVTTYKILAEKCRTSPRAIGRVMASNRDPLNYPCYKVVHSDGSVGGYSGGIEKKIQLLRKGGIEVKNGKIDIKKYLITFV